MFSSLSPQPVRFEPIWTGLADGIGKIVTMTGVKGMPLVECAIPFLHAVAALTARPQGRV